MLVALDLVPFGSPTRQRKITTQNSQREDNNTSNNDSEWTVVEGGRGPRAASTKRRRATVSSIMVPSRRSKRLRGESAEPTTAAEERVVETGDVSEFLATGDAYFAKEALASAIRVTGHYAGWVERGVMERLGIQGNAADAWETEGGGKFSFKDPLGTGKPLKKQRGVTPGGQSVAKYVASKLLRKNPNAYFYRHTEPGVEQWTGDWTDEERDVFLRVARELGCGDKWGLFSTHLPHRVGYQCSNYYRQYVIPAGWIVDDNYRLDSTGHAVYVGKHKRTG
ncbi:hypothetical protein IW140_006252 [Coemansia sp. RSA 1813]|nr:hypothetical protein LPJ74_005780 [Coemansia sp. RSA 1843]KAJ2212316.1 hypothetical protein EV179_004786 [Coemansia sp. RSA 487]KAJ2563020.1 hypothetical protein IW140_006252 [Coemansia sp. RSA 1813]